MFLNKFKSELKEYVRNRNIRISKKNWKKNNKQMIQQQKKRAYNRKKEIKAIMEILL